MFITLPLESSITLSKDGSISVKHTVAVTGEAGQAFVESVVEFMGSSVSELVRTVDEQHGGGRATGPEH